MPRPTWIKNAAFRHVRSQLQSLTGFVGAGVVSGHCVLSLDFKTEKYYAPVGLTSQEIDVWIRPPMGSSICWFNCMLLSAQERTGSARGLGCHQPILTQLEGPDPV